MDMLTAILEKYKYVVLGLVAFLFVGILIIYSSGRSTIDHDSDGVFFELYHIDSITNELTHERRRIDLDEGASVIRRVDYVLSELSNVSGNIERISILPEGVRVLNRNFFDEAGALYLNFSPEYMEIPNYDEIVTRAGLVRALTSIDGVESVNIFVGGRQIVGSTGIAVNNLRRNNMRISPQILHTEERPLARSIKLFFVADDLSGLEPRFERLRITSEATKVSEVLNALLEMSHTEGNNLFVSPLAQVLHVDIQDNIAYIDFSSEFDATPPQGDRAQFLTVYAIVNTLTSLEEIDVVEFLIEAQRLTEFEGYVNLGQSFMLKEDIILQDERYYE